MYKPRNGCRLISFGVAKYHKGSPFCFLRKINSGQSVAEYVIIFAIVAVLSVIMVANMPGIFSGYVNSATGAMR